MALSKKYDAVICLGAVIRGATPHFEYIAAEVSKGVAMIGLESEVPVTFGVLTTDNLEQAIERAGTKAGNKGWDAALSAIEMANLYREMKAKEITFSPQRTRSSQRLIYNIFFSLYTKFKLKEFIKKSTWLGSDVFCSAALPRVLSMAKKVF